MHNGYRYGSGVQGGIQWTQVCTYVFKCSSHTYIQRLITNRDGCLSDEHFLINSSPSDHGIDEVFTAVWGS